MVAGDCMVVALSEELDDMEAEHPARNDSRAVAGLTRKAIEAADLVVDSILAMETKKTVGRPNCRSHEAHVVGFR